MFRTSKSIFEPKIVLSDSSRNEALGQEALAKLKTELGPKGEKLRFHQLDVTNTESTNKLAQHIKGEHGGLDILINNAGIAYQHDSTAPLLEQAESSIAVNYTGIKNVSDSLFPLLRPHARVVNVCSRAGSLYKGYSDEIKKRISDPNITREQLDAIMDEYVKLIKDGANPVERGFHSRTYFCSKAAAIALSFIQSKQLSKDPRADLVVNACCPGYVATDLTKNVGLLSVDEGADTPVYLALLPPNTDINGKFIAERKEVDWLTVDLEALFAEIAKQMEAQGKGVPLVGLIPENEKKQ